MCVSLPVDSSRSDAVNDAMDDDNVKDGKRRTAKDERKDSEGHGSA